MQEKMTPQEVFDTVTKHLLKQNSVSLSEDGSGCAYRGLDGLKCAVGCLITDEEYRSDMENQAVATVLNFASRNGITSLSNRLDEHIIILNRLQIIHDRTPIHQWPDRLEGVAKDYNFSMPNELVERLKA